MKRKIQYIIAAILTTIGVLLWSTGENIFFNAGTIFVSVCTIILTDKRELFYLKKTEWNLKKFIDGLFFVLIVLLFMILLYQLPEGRIMKLLSKWYFSGTTWLILMTSLIKRYIEEQEKSQQSIIQPASKNE